MFLNCPFDLEYAPLLQAVAFCVVFLGFYPRLAPENSDNAIVRLERIDELIRHSKYGIHDLSRCKCDEVGQFSRMNRPFELGLDHGCKRFGANAHTDKQILILEETRYDYQKALSDIAGWDIQTHSGDYQKAVRRVRDWLIRQAGADNIGAALILGKYLAFQEWYYQRELATGASKDDIQEYPTDQMVRSMHTWMDEGQPG